MPTCQELTVLDNAPFGQMENGTPFRFLRLEPPGWERWRPGQFVMLRDEDWGAEITWARPLSICNSDEFALTVFFQAVGRGTNRLTRLQKGDKLTVWGPLGRGFAVEQDTPTLMLAGGIGIAPFVGYSLRHPAPELLHLVFGHRTPLDCYPMAAFSMEIRKESYYEQSPEDLAAFLGIMEEHIEEYAEQGLVLACGPTPFLKAIQKIGLDAGARVQLSLENRMACGVGACLGCVTRDHAGNRVQVCSKGPVFWADKVQLDE